MYLQILSNIQLSLNANAPLAPSPDTTTGRLVPTRDVREPIFLFLRTPRNPWPNHTSMILPWILACPYFRIQLPFNLKFLNAALLELPTISCFLIRKLIDSIFNRAESLLRLLPKSDHSDHIIGRHTMHMAEYGLNSSPSLASTSMSSFDRQQDTT